MTVRSATLYGEFEVICWAGEVVAGGVLGRVLLRGVWKLSWVWDIHTLYCFFLTFYVSALSVPFAKNHQTV